MAKFVHGIVAELEKVRAEHQLVGFGHLITRLSQTGRFLDQQLINLLKK